MLAAIIVVLAVVADQLTKYLVVQNIEVSHSRPFIDGFMQFYHTRNTGGGWSILNGGGSERVILITVSLLAIAMVVYVLATNYHRHPLLNVALAMVLGGGAGNMIDRIRLEYVVDFLRAEFIEFPTFNIADCFITVGAALLVIYVLFYDAKAEKRILAEKAANDTLVNSEEEKSVSEPESDENEACEPEISEPQAENTENITEEKVDNE